MKKLEIKGLETRDITLGVDAFNFDSDPGLQIKDSSDVNFELRLEIGDIDDDWDEIFYVQIVTPANRPRNNPSVRFIPLPMYSFEALKAALTKILTACERDTREECVEELRRYFRWEYW